MFDIDQETWIYFVIIAGILVYFLSTSRRTKEKRKSRKNRDFRRRYLQRRKEEGSDTTLHTREKL
ncbi:MAG: hypothetical protein WBV47_07375 [Salegentibacter sp.]